jgi:hypothetical protein
MIRTFVAEAPYDPLARLLMDHNFRLLARDDPEHEFAKLGRPSKDDPREIVTIYRCGCVHVSGETWEKAAQLLLTIAGVPR